MTHPLADYLAALERALRSLPAEERTSIIAEIRSHIEDSTAATGKPIADVLENLGDPLELARAYLDQRKLEDAVVQSAHGTLLVAILERATRNVAAFVFALISALLYLCSIVFIAIAVFKPIIPANVGLWWGPDVHAFGIIYGLPAGAREILGYWVVPVGVIAAILCYSFASKLMRVGGRQLLKTSARQLKQI